MTDGRLGYTPDEALAHFAPDTHHRAVGSAQLDAERLRQCAVTSAFGLLAGGGGKGWSGNKCVARGQLQELSLGFGRLLLPSVSHLAVVEPPCGDTKFRKSFLVGDPVLLAVGHNLRYFFACHHKKNVFPRR